jgi:hypothetical protein
VYYKIKIVMFLLTYLVVHVVEFIHTFVHYHSQINLHR